MNEDKYEGLKLLEVFTVQAGKAVKYVGKFCALDARVDEAEIVMRKSETRYTHIAEHDTTHVESSGIWYSFHTRRDLAAKPINSVDMIVAVHEINRLADECPECLGYEAINTETCLKCAAGGEEKLKENIATMLDLSLDITGDEISPAKHRLARFLDGEYILPYIVDEDMKIITERLKASRSTFIDDLAEQLEKEPEAATVGWEENGRQLRARLKKAANTCRIAHEVGAVSWVPDFLKNRLEPMERLIEKGDSSVIPMETDVEVLELRAKDALDALRRRPGRVEIDEDGRVSYYKSIEEGTQERIRNDSSILACRLQDHFDGAPDIVRGAMTEKIEKLAEGQRQVLREILDNWNL